MPPTPGIFPVPYGTTTSHSHNVPVPVPSSAVISSSSSAQVIGPGVPGPVAGFHLPPGPPNVKLSRLDMAGQGLAQEVYGPGIGHGLHPHSHLHGHGHTGHLQSHQLGHGHHGMGGSGLRHATSGTMDESLNRKERRKRELSKHNRDAGDRRDDPSRHITERMSALYNTAQILCTRPDVSFHFKLRLYPLSLERSALLAQFEAEERYAVELAQIAYEEERERVEEEWRKGRERVRERLLEGIEERRRRAREEKEGEGTVGDASLDSHSRPPITRKLRNKLGGGTSPPPTPQTAALNGFPSSSLGTAGTGTSGIFSSTANLPITTGPFLNPHSLNVDDLPSPFPLPLTASGLAHSTSTSTLSAIASLNSSSVTGGTVSAAVSIGGSGGAMLSNGGRRRVKGGGGHQGQALGGLGKSLVVLNMQKESIDIENDLNEIKRGNKRRRAAAAGSVKS